VRNDALSSRTLFLAQGTREETDSAFVHMMNYVPRKDLLVVCTIPKN